MQTVDGVGDTKLSGENGLNISLVAQIGLENDDLGSSWNIGLNNIDKDEVNIGSERVVVEGGGELRGK
jgi:hypothetical protein